MTSPWCFAYFDGCNGTPLCPHRHMGPFRLSETVPTPRIFERAGTDPWRLKVRGLLYAIVRIVPSGAIQN